LEVEKVIRDFEDGGTSRVAAFEEDRKQVRLSEKLNYKDVGLDAQFAPVGDDVGDAGGCNSVDAAERRIRLGEPVDEIAAGCDLRRRYVNY